LGGKDNFACGDAKILGNNVRTEQQKTFTKIVILRDRDPVRPRYVSVNRIRGSI